jgi:hypothetical protein
MTVANLTNILTLLVCPHSFVVLNCSLSLGAAGCSHLEGRGIHLHEYVYCTLFCLPTESINYSLVTMMSWLMLNLCDLKMLISTQAATTVTPASSNPMISTFLDSHLSLTNSNEEFEVVASSPIGLSISPIQSMTQL